jgi:DNA anti-recombination protein RmuC
MGDEDRAIGRLEGRLDSLEENFKTHRKEMRKDIKDGFTDLNKTLNGKLTDISGQFDRRIEQCDQTHDTRLRQAHGRMKGLDDRLGKVEHGQGNLYNWKHWVLGGLGVLTFLIIVAIALPPAIQAIKNLFGG